MCHQLRIATVFSSPQHHSYDEMVGRTSLHELVHGAQGFMFTHAVLPGSLGPLTYKLSQHPAQGLVEDGQELGHFFQSPDPQQHSPK